MKIIKKIFFALFLLITFIYLYVIISPKIFKDYYPFGIRTAVILTGSMEPTLEINDFVIVRKPDNIKLYDIISYKEKNSDIEILHRVIAINGNEIITKGDANNKEDTPININQVTGIYIGKMKYLGKVIAFITRPIVFSIVITSLFIIMLIPSKNNIYK